MKSNEKYGWSCGYEIIDGSDPNENERCFCKSKTLFPSKEEAIRDSLHHNHSDSVYVYSNRKGYIGLSKGLMFNIK